VNAITDGTTHADRSEILAYEILSDPKPQPGSIDPFSGEERFENAGERCGFHTLPSIRDGDAHSLPPAPPFSRFVAVKYQSATLFHCIYGISHDVKENLTKFTLMALQGLCVAPPDFR
jgi:hypothetical protein